MLTQMIMVRALERATPELDRVKATGVVKGMEAAIQKALHAELGSDALREKKLSNYGGVPEIAGNKSGVIDIVYPGKKLYRAIELKVVRLPRIKNGAANALYDLGQMTVDYARTQRASKLEGGELVALLHGPITEALPEGELARAFHHHMFIDYETSRRFGELRPDHLENLEDQKRVQRVRQIKAAKHLGWDRPFVRKNAHATVAKVGNYALISIPIVPIGRR